MVRILIGLIIIVSIIFFVVGGYFLGAGQNQKGETPSTGPASSTSSSPTSTTSSPSPKPADGKALLIKALYNKSYDELLPFFAGQVDVLIEATECCGIKKGAEADTRVISYLDSAKGEWNFDQNSPAIVGIKGQNPAGFQNTLVGTADNKYTLKLTLDENSKIKIVVFANL